MKLREVVEKGDQLLSTDPQTPAVGNEVSMLQAGWEDLYRQAGIRRRHLNKAKVLQVCGIEVFVLVEELFCCLMAFLNG